jgi:hypothetical protein
MRALLIAVLATSIAFVSSNVLAQAPDSLGFQGNLTDSLGNPITQAGVGMTFTLYVGGSPVWTEPQSVDVTDGVFHVLLGKVTDLSTLAFNEPMELGIKIDTEASEMTPKTPLAATPYARALPGLYTVYADDGPSQSHNVVGGGDNNVVSAGAVGVTISGGGGVFESVSHPNQVHYDFGTVGGGGKNVAIDRWGTVSGGRENSAAFEATVGGGALNNASQANTTVSGGKSNNATLPSATVGGGESNTASGSSSTVSGGNANTASGPYATVGGGNGNTASGNRSTVAGGFSNTATGLRATVPGGNDNDARGDYSFAAGHKAKAIHEGTFVWNDRSITTDNDSLLSTGPNQFLIRAQGGVGINTAPAGGIHLKQAPDSAGIKIEYQDDSDDWEIWTDFYNDFNWSYNGAILSFIEDEDGMFYVYSDERLKSDIRPYGSVLENVVQLTPSTYRYNRASPSSPRALGVIAQEIEPLFPELVSQKAGGMKAVNYSGLSVVAIKAIQELYALVEAQQAEIAQLREIVEDGR